MRIALVYDAVYPFVAGGVERRNYAVADALADDHSVALYGFDYWDGRSEGCLPRCRYVGLGGPVPLYGADGRRRVSEAIIFAARMLMALLRSDEDVWDVANFPFFSVPAAWLASRVRRRGLIVTWYEFWGDYWYRYLGWRGIFGRYVELLALRCSPRVITTSEMTRRRLVAAGCPSDRIRLVPCGVDIEAIRRARKAEKEYDLICVGRLLAHKRVELALEALLRVREQRPDATLAVVGDGPRRGELERRAVELGLGGAVRFFGKLPNAEQVYALMKSSRVLVAPSEREGFGIAVIEGWACGLPAVACAGAENAVPELIDRPFKGRVVAASAVEIAAACCELLQRPGRNDEASLAEAAAAYDWRRVARRLETVYRDALAPAPHLDSAGYDHRDCRRRPAVGTHGGAALASSLVPPDKPLPVGAARGGRRIHRHDQPAAWIPRNGEPLFDAYAECYDEVLNASLSASGETKEYFARGRLNWLAKRLERVGFRAHNVLDFGCGTGTSAPLFFEYLRCRGVLGVDVSRASLAFAARAHRSLPQARFAPLDEHEPRGDVDLAFSNGVFHHIGPSQRPAALRHILRSLRPGGIFAFWENNPWNPGTRHCMRVNPFDRDAIAVWPCEARRLLIAARFQIVEATYAFYFPRPLRRLRWLEPAFSWLPFGAQYLLLARKPFTRHQLLDPYHALRPTESIEANGRVDRDCVGNGLPA
ncbi:MAG TPA: glycosyltransferase [Pirellulales bacterium]|nr:glycosyltransferase [Pirellulales bacterium]